jgi:hypothetical protein
VKSIYGSKAIELNIQDTGYGVAHFRETGVAVFNDPPALVVEKIFTFL